MMRSRIELANILLIAVLAVPVLYANSDAPGGAEGVADRQQGIQIVERTAKQDEMRARRDERQAIKKGLPAGGAAGEQDVDPKVQEQAEANQKELQKPWWKIRGV